MKKYLKLTGFALSAIFCAAFAPVAFGQIGACGAACDVPPVASCAPTCAIPEPTCAPTCAIPEPTCAPTCEPSCGLGLGCGPCDNGILSLIDGAVRVATAPLRMIACGLSDGIYPDCGCAPRPPKTDCNPCNICGDYVGGCNDNCKTGPCGNYRVGPYSSLMYQGSTINSNVEYYDSEAYDSSPTRSNVNVPNFGARAAIQTRNLPNYDRNAVVAQRVEPNQNVNYVRSVSFEEMKRPIAAPAASTRALQDKNNVRIVESPERLQTPAAAGKTFGVVRPVK